MRLAAQAGEAYKALLEDNLLAAEARPHPRDPAGGEEAQGCEDHQAATQEPLHWRAGDPAEEPTPPPRDHDTRLYVPVISCVVVSPTAQFRIVIVAVEGDVCFGSDVRQ